MKITLETETVKVSIEADEVVDITATRDLILIPALLAYGFHSDNVRELFFDEEEES